MFENKKHIPTVSLSHGEDTECVKPGLHLNANRTQMRHAKMMQMFDVDLLPRRGKQHLAVRQTFGK